MRQPPPNSTRVFAPGSAQVSQASAGQPAGIQHRAASDVEAGVAIVLLTAMELEKKRDWRSTPVYSAVREGKNLV